MKPDEEDLFTVEFQHATVLKMVRGIVDGSMTLNLDKRRFSFESKEARDSAIDVWADVLTDVKGYFEADSDARKKGEIEHRLFANLLTLQATDCLSESRTIFEIDEDIKQVNDRMDSTNNLLLEVLKVLKKVKDDVEFMRGVFDNLAK